jgi:hypothetical protein
MIPNSKESGLHSLLCTLAHTQGECRHVPDEHLPQVACKLPINVLLCAGQLDVKPDVMLGIRTIWKGHYSSEIEAKQETPPEGSCKSPPTPDNLSTDTRELIYLAVPEQVIALGFISRQAEWTHLCIPSPILA